MVSTARSGCPSRKPCFLRKVTVSQQPLTTLPCVSRFPGFSPGAQTLAQCEICEERGQVGTLLDFDLLRLWLVVSCFGMCAVAPSLFSQRIPSTLIALGKEKLRAKVP